MEATPLRLLDDAPTTLDEDAFSHSSYAEVVYRALSDAAGPLTLGLFGTWGAGKSSVLRAVERRFVAEQPRAIWVAIDAWRYDPEGVRREMLRKVSKAVAEDQAWWRRRAARRRAEARLAELDRDTQTTRWRTRFTIGGFAVAAVQAGFVGMGLYLATKSDAYSEWLPGSSSGQSSASLPALVALLTFGATAIGQAARLAPTTTTRRRTEEPERFSGLFTDAIESASASQIVVAVDNLDRCSQEVAVTMLATIKAYLEPAVQGANQTKRARRSRRSKTNVVFVVAVDQKALGEHLAETGGRSDAGPELLRKVFGAAVILSPFERGDLRAFALSRIKLLRPTFGTPEDELVLATLVDAAGRTTPRQIIKMLNDLALELRVSAARREHMRATDHQVKDGQTALLVGKLAVIRECWPSRYEQLTLAPHLLDEWHRQARSAGPSALESEFAGFLRVSDSVDSSDLRRHLLAGRGLVEVELPGYWRFRALVTTGARSDLEAFLDEADVEEGSSSGFLAQLPQIFREECDAGALVAARLVVDAALTQRRLGPDSAEATALIEPFFADPRLHEERDALAADLLVKASVHANPTVGRDIAQSVLSRLNHRDRTVEAAEALAFLPATFHPLASKLVSQFSTSSPLAEDPEALATIARDHVDWLGQTSVDVQVRQLEQASTPLQGHAGAETARFFELILDAAHLPAAPAAVLRSLQKAIPNLRELEAFERAARLLCALRSHTDVGPASADLVTSIAAAQTDQQAAAARYLAPLSAELSAAGQKARWIGLLVAGADGSRHLAEVLQQTPLEELAGIGVDIMRAVGRDKSLATRELFHLAREAFGQDRDHEFENALIDALADLVARGADDSEIRRALIAAGLKPSPGSTIYEMGLDFARGRSDPALVAGWLVVSASDPTAVSYDEIALFLDQIAMHVGSPSPKLVRRFVDVSLRINDMSRLPEFLSDVMEFAAEADTDDAAGLLTTVANVSRFALSNSRARWRAMCLERGRMEAAPAWRDWAFEFDRFDDNAERIALVQAIVDDYRDSGDAEVAGDLLARARGAVGDEHVASTLAQFRSSDEVSDRRVIKRYEQQQ